jgi:thymidylate synthase
MTTMMRSNDVWFGLPYDIVFFTEVQKYIARKMGITAGVYTHFVVSLHMYLRDEEKLKKFYRP